MSEVVKHIPYGKVRPNETLANDRTEFDQAALEELAASIKEHGLIQPVTVRPGPDGGDWWELIAGERRWRAIGLLGWETIPALVRDLSDEAAAGIMLVENVNREDISPVEEAKAYQKRMDRFGWDVRKVAATAKKTTDHVRKRLGLLSLVPELQAMVARGQVPLGHAELLRDLNQESQAIAVAALASRDGLPSLATFRVVVVAPLLARQDQMAMVFDLEEVAAELRASLEAAAPQRTAGRPMREDLPRVENASGKGATAGRLALKWADRLRSMGKEAEASVVDTLIEDMVRQGMINV